MVLLPASGRCTQHRRHSCGSWHLPLRCVVFCCVLVLHLLHLLHLLLLLLCVARRGIEASWRCGVVVCCGGGGGGVLWRVACCVCFCVVVFLFYICDRVFVLSCCVLLCVVLCLLSFFSSRRLGDIGFLW